jgi:hypothetical protein
VGHLNFFLEGKEESVVKERLQIIEKAIVIAWPDKKFVPSQSENSRETV